MPRSLVAALVLSVFAATCGTRDDPAALGEPTTTTSPTEPETASDGGTPPWASPPLDDSVPHEAGGTCPPMSFANLGDGAGATSRKLVHNIGVAWDKPGSPGQDPDGSPSATSGRSTFGLLAFPRKAEPLQSWAFRIEWDDGSAAGYGYEGETDPRNDPNPLKTTKWLAQLNVEGHNCSFNVWSHLGRKHLEHLLSSLRYVRAS